MAAAPGDEAERYRAFVERSLDELRCGLVLDNGNEKSKKGRIAQAFRDQKAKSKERDTNAAQLVLEGRFLLGEDDAAYLSSGLGLLWSTVGDAGSAERGGRGASELELAPAALYMPEATNGIRKGLLRALKAKHVEASQGDKCAQLRVFLKALRPFANVQEIKRIVDPDGKFASAIDAYSCGDRDPSVDTLKALALGLVRFKELLQKAYVGSGSLADQILQAQSVQVKSIETELRKAEAEAEAATEAQRASAEELARLRAELERLRAELQAAKAIQEASEMANSRLTKERNDATASLSEKTAKLSEEEAKCKGLAAKLAKAESDCASRMESFQKQASKVAEQQAKVAATTIELMKTELEGLEKELEAARAALEAKAGSVSKEEHEAKIAKLENQVQEYKESLKEHVRMVQEAREAALKSRQERDAFETQAQELKPTVDTLRAQNERLMGEVTRLRSQLEAKQLASADAANAERLFADASRKIAELDKVQTELNQQAHDLQSQREAVQKAKNEAEKLQDELKEHREKETALKAQVDALQVQVDTLRTELAQCEKEHAASLAREAALEEQVAGLQEAVDACKQEEARLEAALIDTEKQRRMTIANAHSILVYNKPNSPLVQSTLQRVREARANNNTGLAQDTQQQLATELAEAEAQVKVVVDDIQQRVAKQEEGVKINPVSSRAMMQLVDDVAEMQKADDVLNPAQNTAIKDAITRTSGMVQTVMVETAVTGMAEQQGIEKEQAREVIESKILVQELKGKGLLEGLKEKAKRAVFSVLADKKTYTVLSAGTQALIGYWSNPAATAADVASNPETWREWAWNALESAGRSAASYSAKVPVGTKSLYDADPDVATAVLRGLVGQRGPTEPVNTGHCPQDALLPYALPSARELAAVADTTRHVLAHSCAPTREDVLRAECTCHTMLAPPPPPKPTDGSEPAKRPRLAPPIDALDGETLVTAAEALAALEGNYAVTGLAPARADDARKGVETPHEVRWMPQGPRAATMARAAVLEHAVARCAQVATRADTPAPVARALHGAAATLKLRQLEPLYALKEAAAFEDEPHPLGTEVPLVTRPCAVVRGVLSFPTDAGVAPRPAQIGTGKPGTDTAKLEQAMGTTAAATAALRNRLRREKAASHLYVAPPAHALAFREAPTGRVILAGRVLDRDEENAYWRANPDQVGAEGYWRQNPDAPGNPNRATAADPADDVHEAVDPLVQSVDNVSVLTNRALVLLAGMWPGTGLDTPPDAVAAYLDAEALEDDAGAVTVQTRRDGLWTEFQRHLAISQDRLWVFVRLLSGGIGGDVSEVITMADEATLAATRAVQQQRVEISKQVSNMQAKIVETVVGSMLKSSGLTLDYEKDHLTVIDAEAKKKLQELAAGTSGRPFFEANVALRNLDKEGERAKPTLSEVLKSLATAGTQMQATLEANLQEPGTGAASLAELSHPTNSYFVALRPDATAAIREAQEKLNVELVLQGGARRLALWELVEGGCVVLTNRFADFCGFLLVQKRSSTGVSAMYVSHLSIRTNASQARISLARLVAAACAYAARVPAPRFLDHEDVGRARSDALTAAEAVLDSHVIARPVTLVRNVLASPVHSSGWGVVGGRQR